MKIVEARNAVKELIILALIALLAGMTACCVYLCVYLTLSNILGIKVSRLAVSFTPTTVGVVTALAIEGVWKGNSFKDIMLKRVFPAIVRVAIAYCTMWLLGIIR